MVTKMVSFNQFKKDPLKSYAYLTILALISVFGILMNKYNSIDEQNKAMLAECEDTNKELHVKIEELNQKILDVVMKVNKTEKL